MEPNKPKVVKWALILGIVIVLNLFINYSLSLIYNAPEYTDFCKQDMSPTKMLMDTPEKCTAKGGQWNPPLDIEGSKGYCDEQFTCRQQFDDANKIFEKNVFVTLVVLGVIIIAASIFIKGQEVLALALSLGAVLDFIIASVRYWSYADNLLKVVILGVALLVLVWLAIKKFNK